MNKKIVNSNDNNLLSYGQYGFYIELNKVLILIKQLCDNYEYSETRKNINKDSKKNFNSNFKLSDAKSI